MNNSRLTISIAMCTYNGEKYLQEQLDSLAKQSRLPDELVICDDCSSDKTMEILQNFVENSPFPVRLEQNEKNLGYIRNFEKCSQLCTGDIIFFCDQDDVWLPEKIERFMEFFENEPNVGMVISDVQMMDAHSKLLKSRYSYSIYPIAKLEKMIRRDAAYFLCKISCSSWPGMAIAYRKSVGEILFPYPFVLAHDSWVLQTMCAVSQARIIPEPMVLYRIHEKNVVGKQFDKLSVSIQEAGSKRIIDNYKNISDNLTCILDRIKERPNLNISPKTLALYKAKAEHCLIRYRIRTKQVNKWYYILRETLNGNYFRFGNGILSIGMDLLS